MHAVSLYQAPRHARVILSYLHLHRSGSGASTRDVEDDKKRVKLCQAKKRITHQTVAKGILVYGGC